MRGGLSTRSGQPDSPRDAVLSNKPQGAFSTPAEAFATWHVKSVADSIRQQDPDLLLS